MWHARLAAPSSLCCKRRGCLEGGGANEVRLERVAMPRVGVGSSLTPHPNRTPLRTVVERSWGRASMEPRRGREEGRGRGRVELRGRGEQDMCGGTTTWWCESEKAEERVVREENRRDRLSASVEESAVGAHSGLAAVPRAASTGGSGRTRASHLAASPGPSSLPASLSACSSRRAARRSRSSALCSRLGEVEAIDLSSSPYSSPAYGGRRKRQRRVHASGGRRKRFTDLVERCRRARRAWRAWPVGRRGAESSRRRPRMRRRTRRRKAGRRASARRRRAGR